MSGQIQVTAVTPLGGVSYRLSVMNVAGILVGDYVGAPTLTGDGVYEVTAVDAGAVTIDVDDDLDLDGGTYGAPIAGYGFFATPKADDSAQPPYGAKSWNATRNRNERLFGLATNITDVDERIFNGRLSVHATEALGEGTNATTLYLHRYSGKRISLFNGLTWSSHELPATPTSIATAAYTATNVYDVFVYDVSTVLTLELVAWSNVTTRATALGDQDGVLVQSGSPEKRYVGSVYLDGSKFIDDDTTTGFFGVWNMYNRIKRSTELLINGAATWTHSANGTRKANAATTADIYILSGIQTYSWAWSGFNVGACDCQSSSQEFYIGLDGTSAWIPSGRAYVNNGEIVPAQVVSSGLLGRGLRSLSPVELHSGPAVANTMGPNGGIQATCEQ